MARGAGREARAAASAARVRRRRLGLSWVPATWSLLEWVVRGPRSLLHSPAPGGAGPEARVTVVSAAWSLPYASYVQNIFVRTALDVFSWEHAELFLKP
jgi:hypothetical protein